MSKKMPTKKQSEIIGAIKSTLENSSINGIPNIIRNKFNLVKLVWLVCILASSGICAWFVLDIITKYYRREVVSRINVKKESVLPFPIVYICDNFGFKNKIKLNDRIFYAKIYLGNELSIQDEFKPKDIGDHSCFQYNSAYNMKYITDKSILDTLHLELYIGSPLKLKANDLNGLIVKISDSSQSPAFRFNDIYIMPGTVNNIYVHRTIVKRQPYPYSECREGLDSVVTYFYRFIFI